MRRITLYIYQNSYVSQSGGGAPKAWITPDHPGSPRITPSDPHGSPPLEHPGSSTDHPATSWKFPPGRCFSGTWVLFYTLQESITPFLGYLGTFLPAPRITYVKFFYRLRVLYM